MRIVIAGGSGFIGSALVDVLLKRGDDVAVLTRDAAHLRGGRAVQWSPPQAGTWTSEVRDADAVVNLAGENIAGGRWTDERKQRLLASRIDATSALVRASESEPRAERRFVSASAVGFYGLRGDEVVGESSSAGRGFLAELSTRWEAAAFEAASAARVIVLRFGVVLDRGGGALAKMLPPFRVGAGGPLGSGRQWMSWVARDDAIRAIEWAIDDPAAEGVYNVTAPQPVTNRDFAKALGAALHRPAVIHTPAFALKLAFGEMAEEALLGGQRVIPARLQAAGFRFEEPEIGKALRSIFA